MSAALSTLVLAALTACGQGDQHVAQAGGNAVGAEPELQGLWALQAPGEPQGATLDLDGGDWTLTRSCAQLTGTWAARDSLFLANTDGFPAEYSIRNRQCANPGWTPADGLKNLPAQAPKMQAPTWIYSVAGYRRNGAGWNLMSREGRTIAELMPGPTPPADEASAFVMEPGGSEYPDREERARLNALDAAPLPAGVFPAESENLVGRWEPDLGRKLDGLCDMPWVEFSLDGSWKAHDVQDDTKGRWVLAAGGLALGTAGSDRMTGCDQSEFEHNADASGGYVDVWFLRLARLGLDGPELVFYDPEGLELARVHRIATPTPTPTPTPPEPEDPRTHGVPVPGGVKYLAYTDEGSMQFFSGRHSVGDDAYGDTYFFGVDRSGKGAALMTGCVMGNVWVTVHPRTTAPAPLAASIKGWDVGEEVTMTITEPLWGMDVFGESWGEEVFKPTVPGLHRVRVLAKGRAAGSDADVCEGEPVESYDITIWPVLTKEPQVRRGEDKI